MALATYFRRSAVAASQVMSGYDEAAIQERLEAVNVGVSVDDEVPASAEGRALVDLTVRLLARLYPKLNLPPALRSHDLARAINPNVELSDQTPTHAICIGLDASSVAPVVVYAGSDGWDGSVSTDGAVDIGGSDNPIGAGIAACMAAANIFRSVFLNDVAQLDTSTTLSGLTLNPKATDKDVQIDGLALDRPAVLVGAGAIGNAAAWALSRSSLRGTLVIVDPEEVELSNLQRYSLTSLADVGEPKVDVLSRFFAGELTSEPVPDTWQSFVMERGSHWDNVLVALDSARDRRAVQAALPRWIANAWTQPGDLGVSVHPWTEDGACLSCLYLPAGEAPSEDKLIASALGLPRPDVEARIRPILWANGNAPRDLLEQSAAALSVPVEAMLAYENRPLRQLYVEGICGGAVLPLGRAGSPAQDVHVPLAHQSALAGILLAGRLIAHISGTSPADTQVARIDVMRPLPEFITQPVKKDPRGICICQDAIYREAYSLKYAPQ